MADSRRTALVTGGSRGIGAETVLALAARGYDVAFTYRNKGARAESVAEKARAHGVGALTVACDMTRHADVERLVAEMRAWRGRLDALVLNASGGLERDLVADDPTYAMRLNRDAQVVVVDAALPLMPRGGTIVFVTSHWAHLYGQAASPVEYAPVAETKYAGEQALRGKLGELAQRDLRLLVVTGDLIEGTVTPKLLERAVPGIWDQRRSAVGRLPDARDMGQAIVGAIADEALSNGHTVVVGGTLESVERL